MIDFAEKHVEFILEFRPVLFPINGFNDPFWSRNSTHPVTRPNAFVVLTPCKSEPSTRLLYFRQAIFPAGEYVSDWVADVKKFSVRVLPLGGTANGGRCPSTVVENRTSGRKRWRNDHPSA
jgi:hypothetical protein